MRKPLALLSTVVAVATSCAGGTVNRQPSAAAILFPDVKLTPGKADPGVTAAVVCKPGYAGAARHVTDLTKKAVFAAYKIPYVPANYEVDHFISLELGGSNDPDNLWPQAYSPLPGAHQKDLVEDDLHRQVCGGKMQLAEAQKTLVSSWNTYYDQIKGISDSEDVVTNVDSKETWKAITAQQRKTLLLLLNDACADRWCESRWAFKFDSLTDTQTALTIHYSYKPSDLGDSAPFSESGVCQVPGQISFDDWVETGEGFLGPVLRRAAKLQIDRCLSPILRPTQ